MIDFRGLPVARPATYRLAEWPVAQLNNNVDESGRLYQHIILLTNDYAIPNTGYSIIYSLYF